MRRETRNHIQRQIGALELRIGVDHHGNIDRVRDGAKVRFDLRIAKREIRFQDGEDAVGTHLLIGPRLRHRIQRRGRDDAGDHRHPPLRSFNRRLHHCDALHVVEIGELAGRAERRQPVHPRYDEIVAEPAEYFGTDLPVGVNRRDQIGKDAVEIGHGTLASEIGLLPRKFDSSSHRGLMTGRNRLALP